jgi:Kef-type K+ transport system membrane component KefB
MSGRLNDLTVIVLLPVFLAFSGLQTDFTKLGTDVIAGLVAFIAVGVVAKWAAGLLFGRLGGLSWAEANVIGVLMNCRGLLVLVVALIAFNQGVISAPMQVGGVLMALITTAMTGPLMDRFVPSVARRVEQAPAGARH